MKLLSARGGYRTMLDSDGKRAIATATLLRAGSNVHTSSSGIPTGVDDTTAWYPIFAANGHESVELALEHCEKLSLVSRPEGL
jgi:hypothetical protein